MGEIFPQSTLQALTLRACPIDSPYLAKPKYIDIMNNSYRLACRLSLHGEHVIHLKNNMHGRIAYHPFVQLSAWRESRCPKDVKNNAMRSSTST